MPARNIVVGDFSTAAKRSAAGLVNGPTARLIGFCTVTGQLIVGGTAVEGDSAIKRLLVEGITTYASDGALALVSSVDLLTKGSAAAMTIAAPGADGIGIRKTITAGSDFAHVVTFTGGTLRDGTTGGHTTWTSAAFEGSSLTVVGISATKWNVESMNLGTIA